MTGTGFVLRTPWYHRVREGVDLRSPLAGRPRLQMYDTSQFVHQLLRFCGYASPCLQRGRVQPPWISNPESVF